MTKILTPLLKAGPITLGKTEANNQPFENATTDFEHINKHLSKNPAYKRYHIPDALVSSCSECCMKEINGNPNLLGLLFRTARKENGCRNCPVSIASTQLPARDKNGKLLQNSKGQILSESDLINQINDNEP